MGTMSDESGSNDEHGRESDDASTVGSAFERTVGEGEERLDRTWPGLFATGLVGGIDVGFGIFAQIIVQEATHSELLGAVAFTIGFIAVTLANSELFTEDFLVPIAALVAGRSTVRQLVRLWSVTLVLNLIGGWLLSGLTMAASPKLHETAVELGRHFIDVGIGWESMAAALLGGAILTLMTWMERSTPSVPAKLVAAFSVGFVVAAAPLAHVVVTSQEMFSALHSGAPFGYLDWLGTAAWAALGNVIGGMLLVTGLRLIQVGAPKVGEEREAGGRPAKPPSVDTGTTE
jgi:formate/nitrite transporter FocA (FNT family)